MREAPAELLLPEPDDTASLRALADRLWSDAPAGAREERDVEAAIAASVPLAIAGLSDLSATSAAGWLEERGIHYETDGDWRSLRAFLVATRGTGLVFLDASLDEADRRRALAHELGHFLLDYLEPRRQVIDQSPDLLEVIDGRRDGTRSDRARASLQRVPIGIHTHRLSAERGDQDLEPGGSAASRFAREFLARLQE